MPKKWNLVVRSLGTKTKNKFNAEIWISGARIHIGGLFDSQDPVKQISYATNFFEKKVEKLNLRGDFQQHFPEIGKNK